MRMLVTVQRVAVATAVFQVNAATREEGVALGLKAARIHGLSVKDAENEVTEVTDTNGTPIPPVPPQSNLYVTDITFKVMSDTPVTDQSMEWLLEETDSGGMVGHEASRICRPVSKGEMVAELQKAGSDASFFNL